MTSIPMPPAARADDTPTAAHRLTLQLVALGATLLALSLAAPMLVAWLPPLPWQGLPPLHRRCLAAMLAAEALAAALASRDGDLAHLRIPLALAGTTAAGLAAALSMSAGAAGAWLPALLAGACGALLFSDRELRAPAERPQPLLLALALAAAATAALLALQPALAARAWPWPLPPLAATAYAAHFAAWAVALALLARERRRGARQHTLWALALLGAAVVLASLLHAGAFHHASGRAAWIAGFGGLTLVALQRLRARWPH